MANITGWELFARSLKSVGVDTMFFLLGGPMSANFCERQGIKTIDVRHEQGASMMAHAYSRVARKPGVCMTGAGPDALNLITGIAVAQADCSPLVALCGSSSIQLRDMGIFQEMEQLNPMKPVVKRAFQVPCIDRIPFVVNMAFSETIKGKAGPVYVDFPADCLTSQIDEQKIPFMPYPPRDTGRAMGDPDQVKKAINALRKAEHPVILVGSGAYWADASHELQKFVELTGIPCYTTPAARGLIPEDHKLCFPAARSTAFKGTDVLLVIGTRSNWIVNHFFPPVFPLKLKLIEVNIEAEEIGRNRPADIGIVGDAKAVLKQLIEEAQKEFDSTKIAPWAQTLRKKNEEKAAMMAPALNTNQTPIHPWRLCKEIRDVLPRDGILAVDGQQALVFSNQSIPAYSPGCRLLPGPSGCMGVAVPFAIGAKVASPERTVMALSGDGSFGMNGMEIDTAVRHKIPVVIVVLNNRSWGGLPEAADVYSPIDLGYTGYDKIAEAFGAWGRRVEKPDELRPALQEALACGRPAVVNVITDPKASAETRAFADYPVI
ncbi:MAG: thiamine pyrophosphate-binding protein [Dehalococcoidia bacterium]